MELEKYNISAERGFIPNTDLLLSLPEAFRPWEEIGAGLSDLISAKQLRTAVGRLPSFPVDELKKEAEWWRAYTLLTFISHSYVWCEGDEGVTKVLPASLAIPWCAAAKHLGMPATRNNTRYSCPV